MKKPSPALRMMSLALSGNASSRRAGYAIDHAVQAAIHARLRFDPDDIRELRPGRLLNQGVADDWYRLAVNEKHSSAMTAVERFIGQPRYTYNDEVLHVGHTFRWPPAITDENPAGWATVISFAADGQSMKCRASGGKAQRPRAECAVCGSMLYGEKVPQKGPVRPFYTITHKQLAAIERARQLVLEMSFEVQDGDSLREYIGANLGNTWRDQNLIALAKMKVGDSISVEGIGTLTRIAFRTHDALALVGLPEGRRHEREYSYERNEGTGEIEAQVRQLVDAGLATTRDEEHRHEGRLLYVLVHVTLTEAGRRRLIALTPVGNLDAVERAGLDRRLSSYTERQLAAIVRVADSRTAGNCRIGTASWIERHAKGRTEMTVRELVAIDGDNWNVRAAIQQALRRVGLERDEKEPSVVFKDAQPLTPDVED